MPVPSGHARQAIAGILGISLNRRWDGPLAWAERHEDEHESSRDHLDANGHEPSDWPGLGVERSAHSGAP